MTVIDSHAMFNSTFTYHLVAATATILFCTVNIIAMALSLI
jgi:hypothetical protein